jgi:8-oxo-dGTP diphosphatase
MTESDMIRDVWGSSRPYAACFVLLRRGNSVAFVLRSNTEWMNGHYGLPAGKIEKGEGAIAGAVREALEEVGVTIDKKHLSHALTIHRKADYEDMEWIDIYFEVAEWQGEPYNAEPTVHSELAWLDLDQLPDNVVPAVRDALEQIKVGSTYSEFGWNN